MTQHTTERAPSQRYFAIVISRCRLGWFATAAGTCGIVRVLLPRPSRKDLLREVARALPVRDSGSAVFLSAPTVAGVARNCAAVLRRYFTGYEVDFRHVLLDFRNLPDFTRRVYAATRDVPYGATVSYGELARRTGRPRAARAVGRAMAANPFPIIVPCHRVIGGDGSLCGFGGPGGLRQKRRLLALERRRR